MATTQFAAETSVTAKDILPLIKEASERAGVALDAKQERTADIAAAVVCFEQGGKATVKQIAAEWARHPQLKTIACLFQ